jgi:hypothetical protein
VKRQGAIAIAIKRLVNHPVRGAPAGHLYFRHANNQETTQGNPNLAGCPSPARKGGGSRGGHRIQSERWAAQAARLMSKLHLDRRTQDER